MYNCAPLRTASLRCLMQMPAYQWRCIWFGCVTHGCTPLRTTGLRLIVRPVKSSLFLQNCDQSSVRLQPVIPAASLRWIIIKVYNVLPFCVLVVRLIHSSSHRHHDLCFFRLPTCDWIFCYSNFGCHPTDIWSPTCIMASCHVICLACSGFRGHGACWTLFCSA